MNTNSKNRVQLYAESSSEVFVKDMQSVTETGNTGSVY